MEISGIIFSINLILFQMCYYCISRIISTSRIVYNKDGEKKKKKKCASFTKQENIAILSSMSPFLQGVVALQ